MIKTYAGNEELFWFIWQTYQITTDNEAHWAMHRAFRWVRDR